MKKITQGSLLIMITYLKSIICYKSVPLMVELGGKAIFPGKPKQKENDLKEMKIFPFFSTLTVRNHKAAKGPQPKGASAPVRIKKILPKKRRFYRVIG